MPDLARDSAASGSIEHSSRRIAASFTTVFSAWAKPAFSGDHRSRLLAELVCHATDAGIWLFGQSDVYNFDWDDSARDAEHVRGNKVMIAPAVWKLAQNGARLSGEGRRILPSILRQY